MIEFSLSGVPITVVGTPEIGVIFDAERMRSVDGASEVVDATLEVSIDDNSFASIFANEGQLHTYARFNASNYNGSLNSESIDLFDGAVTILESRYEDGELLHKLRIRRSGASWADSAADTQLRELPVEFDSYLTMGYIEEGWSDSVPVKFFPVHRDSYSDLAASSSTSLVDRFRTIDEYHPFANIETMLRAIFEGAGYRIESTILDTDWFKNLYMSGDYGSQESEEAKSAMDFYIKKLNDVETIADYRGRVSFTPYITSNTVGNLVDFDSIDSDSECYTRSGCITEEDGVIKFTPLTQISVGFEYRIKYESEYRIESRTSLKAFDTLYLNTGGLMEVSISNKFEDRRDSTIESSFDYTVIIFDHTDGTTYQAYATLENGNTYLIKEWSGSETTLTTPSYSSSISEIKLYTTQGSYLPIFTGDWALYDGYVELEGSVEVDLTIRTPPETYSPTSPLILDSMFVEGADPDMRFVLKSGTSITPYFAAYPGYGSHVEFSDLMCHDLRQSKLVESVMQLFNLRIYSDNVEKVVYIDSVEDIYDSSQLWDISDMVDQSESIVFEDVAKDVNKVRTWGYQQEDGVTNRSQEFGYEPGELYPDAPTEDPQQSIANSSSPQFGSWCVEIGNNAAGSSDESILNQIFSPTQSDTECVPIVGDRDDTTMVDSLSFSPRILSYIGMMSSGNDTIPHAAFFSPLYNVSLCFEDRDSTVGLSRFYRDEIERDATGQYVTLTLNCSIHYITSLLTPRSGFASVLSRFTFELFGEMCECWIDRIESYDWDRESARVRFLIVK